MRGMKLVTWEFQKLYFIVDVPDPFPSLLVAAVSVAAVAVVAVGVLAYSKKRKRRLVKQ